MKEAISGVSLVLLITGLFMLTEGSPDLYDMLVVKLQQAVTNWNP